jgi:hypothetical protein
MRVAREGGINVPKRRDRSTDGDVRMRRVVLSAMLQAAIREILDAIIRAAGRGGLF